MNSAYDERSSMRSESANGYARVADSRLSGKLDSRLSQDKLKSKPHSPLLKGSVH